MAIQAAICTNCGGELRVDDVDLNGFCECKFCHGKFKVIDVITIDGLPTVKTLLENARNCMADGNFEKAQAFCNKVLEIKPNCHEAWWVLYTTQTAFDRYYGYEDKYGNSGPSVRASIMEGTINKYAFRAIDCAPPQQADFYRSQIAEDISFIENVRNGNGNTPVTKNGCYIATAVYGSYTCPEVLALRGYRDHFLAQRYWGRVFIKVYYKISPFLAKKIRPDSFIGKLIRKYLDRKVSTLI